MSRTSSRRLRAAAVAAFASLGLVLAGAQPADASSHRRHHAPTSYVALGDSYASGEGLAPYAVGSDTADDQCHRSARQSYSQRLERSPLPAFNNLTSVACSGALTGSLFADLPGLVDEGTQLKALSPATTTVTLTIGGNDIGFAPVLASCIYPYTTDPGVLALVPGRPGCAGRDDAAVSAQLGILAGAIPAPAQSPTVALPLVLKAIRAAAPNARVYVSGYPALFGSKIADPRGCRVGALGPIPLFVSGDDAAWISANTARLNAVIKTNVQAAYLAGMQVNYVDAAKAFAGHGLCDAQEPWVNGVVIGGNPPSLQTASFHPTALGQRAYAIAFAYTSLRPGHRPTT